MQIHQKQNLRTQLLQAINFFWVILIMGPPIHFIIGHCELKANYLGVMFWSEVMFDRWVGFNPGTIIYLRVEFSLSTIVFDLEVKFDRSVNLDLKITLLVEFYFVVELDP